MNKLYSFTLPKTVVKKTVETINNEDGSTTTRPKEETVVEEIKFFIKKPNKRLMDSADLFYSKSYKIALQKHELMPIALLNKRIVDDNGFLADKDKEIIEKNETRGKQILMELAVLSQKNPQTDEDKLKIETLAKEYEEIKLPFEAMLMNKHSIYEHTAEAYASRMTVRWWVLHLAYKDLEKPEPYFGEGEFESKQEKFYELTDLAEEDQFTMLTLNAFISLVGMWNRNGLENQKDFDNFFKKYIITSIDSPNES